MAIALPHAVTGTWTTGDTWLPLPTPAFRPVSAEVAPADVAPADDAPASQLDDANPSRAMLLPQAVTGAWTSALAWLPESAPALLPVDIAPAPPAAVAPPP